MRKIFLFASLLCSIIAFAQLTDYLPSSTTGQIIKHTYYSLSYSESHEQAEWVAYELKAHQVNGSVARTDNFRPDNSIPTRSAQLSDYKGSGYDRGHLMPAGDCKHSTTAMSESFYMSNMSPQNPSFNRGIWKTLEECVRTWAFVNEGIYVITGPVLNGKYITKIGPNQVTVPSHYYKIILDYNEPEIKAIALVLPNEKGEYQLKEYVVTIDLVENLTNIDFFPSLPDDIEKVLESSISTDLWSFIPINLSTSSSESPAVQCSGIAKSTGVQCRNKTSNENGYCHYHQDQARGFKPAINPGKLSVSVQCSGTTKAGARCKRKTLSLNGYCWQHGGD